MTRATRFVARSRPRRRPLRVAVALLGTLTLLAGLGMAGQIGWFYARSQRIGGALIRQEASLIQRGRSLPAACRRERARRVRGLLEIPDIGLVAPVVPGVADPQLNVAVGHVPGSPWPGAVGTSLLAAHDVTWFHDLPAVRPGEAIDYLTPCTTLVFLVTRTRVVPGGTPLRDVGRRLVLETCYPLDALYYTSERYLVYARLASRRGGPNLLAPAHLSVEAPRVPAPPALRAEGITLASNPTPLGRLSIRGDAEPGWSESPAPLADAGAAHEVLFAAIRAASQGRRSWWADLAPRVPVGSAGPLVGAVIVAHLSVLQTTLVVRGAHLEHVALAMGVAIAGGSQPGRYLLRVQETVRGRTLFISGWRMSAS